MDCLRQRAICSRPLVPLGGHLALISRCKWRDENFKHFEIFLPPHSNLAPLRATTSQLGGSLSHYTPLGTLLATLGATVNCIGANWHQLAPAQWTPSIKLPSAFLSHSFYPSVLFCYCSCFCCSVSYLVYVFVKFDFHVYSRD